MASSLLIVSNKQEIEWKEVVLAELDVVSQLWYLFDRASLI